jgi:predicted Zn-dependent protease with MMP-like domain
MGARFQEVTSLRARIVARTERSPHMPAMPHMTSIAAMEELARAVMAELPERFRRHCSDVVLTVSDFATQEQLAAVGLVDRWQLSGLYEGRPLPEQSQWQSGEMPPRVWLFRMPLLAEMRATRVPLDELVRHVVIHEIGHHFGFSDEDMHALEREAGPSE